MKVSENKVQTIYRNVTIKVSVDINLWVPENPNPSTPTKLEDTQEYPF